MPVFFMELFLLLATGITTGISLYVSGILFPSWKRNHIRYSLQNFTILFYNTAAVQAVLTTISIVLATILLLLNHNMWWIIGAGFLVINIIFAIAYIAPIDKKLLEGNQDIEHQNQYSTWLDKWGVAYAISTTLNLMCFIIFLAQLLDIQDHF